MNIKEKIKNIINYSEIQKELIKNNYIIKISLNGRYVNLLLYKIEDLRHINIRLIKKHSIEQVKFFYTDYKRNLSDKELTNRLIESIEQFKKYIN